jgi:hypothetical protein
MGLCSSSCGDGNSTVGTIGRMDVVQPCRYWRLPIVCGIKNITILVRNIIVYSKKVMLSKGFGEKVFSVISKSRFKTAVTIP